MMCALALKCDPDAIKMDADTVNRMAAVIANNMHRKHTCSIDDVLAENFSMEEVSRYWAEANRLAAKKRPRPTWR